MGNLVERIKPIFSRRLGYLTMGLRAIISALASRLIPVWLAGTIVVVIVVAGFLAVLPTAPVSAAPEEKAPLECLSCHTRALKGHDKLGSGSAACWVCHDKSTIGVLRLLDGTQLPLADSVPLCGQCHPGRYEAWKEGTHGVVVRKEGEPGVPGAQKMKCIDCHNPHQPKIELSRIIKFYPPPVSEAGAPLDCLSCHIRVLEGHDKLGEGSKACWACHYNMKMGVLHLANEETRLPLSEYPQLCAQCHQARYEAWVEGTHGAPSWQEGIVEVHGAQQVGCIGCHDPHQPQVTLLNITKPHPPPQPPPSPPSVFLLALLGISVVLIVAVGVAAVKKGEQP